MSRSHLSVVYHNPCMDGYGAACAVANKLNSNHWGKAYYVPASHIKLKSVIETGDVSFIPHMTTHLLFVDLCPPKEVIQKLLDLGFEIAILDHHEGVKEIVCEFIGEVKFLIADKYSGASLVKALGVFINHVFNVKNEQRIDRSFEQIGIYTNTMLATYLDRQRVLDSELYTLLEVRDIWIKDDPELKKRADLLSTYFKNQNTAFDDINPNWENEITPNLDTIISETTAIDNYQFNMVSDMVKNSRHINYQWPEGKEVLVVIGSCASGLASLFGEIVNTWYDGNTIAIAVHQNFATGEVGCGIRSKGDYQALTLAKALGGGGHPQASGSALPNDLNMDQLVDYILDKIV